MTPEKILEVLRGQGKKLVFAESITGGLLADAFISVAGASDVVLGSEVTYATELKSALLGVDESLIQEDGVVSESVVAAMAKGVAAVAQGAMELEAGAVISLATTGNAGPATQSGKPVGTAFVALFDGSKVKTRELQFDGTRSEIRQAVVSAAVSLLGEHLGS